MRAWRNRSTALALVAVIGVANLPAQAQEAPPACVPGGEPVSGRVDFAPAQAKTYDLVPFAVAPGTTRIEIVYDWGGASFLEGSQFTSTTVDLGLWDQHGYRDPDGFRGWGGSRHREVFVQADQATRNFEPRPVEPGTWWLEFGIGGGSPDGGFYEYAVTCLDPVVGAMPVADPVDPDHVANPEPGWYVGDFHMHGFHSNPNAPTYDEFVAFARQQGLDFFPLTEYVVRRHWGELGPFQRANPDVLFWPGREIITYYGHVTQFGQTPDVIEYRHGFEDVSLAEVLDEATAAGAMLGVAHPTTFEQPGFESFCRGCGWELADVVDWSVFTTFEVAQGPQVVGEGGLGFENPFTQTAIDLWHELLQEGIRLTGVGASDDKLSGQGSGPTYTPHGVPATAVFASELSVAALADGVQRGAAYVLTRGVAASPKIEVVVTAPDGTVGTLGDTFVADEVEIELTLTGAGPATQLRMYQNGLLVDVAYGVGSGEDRTIVLGARRDRSTEGPLGTWWRFDVVDEIGRTVIANPIFLADALPVGGGVIAPEPSPDPAPEPEPAPSPTPGGSPLPVTGGGAVGVALVGLVVARGLRRRAG